jgi:hypothetical protein
VNNSTFKTHQGNTVNVSHIEELDQSFLLSVTQHPSQALPSVIVMGQDWLQRYAAPEFQVQFLSTAFQLLSNGGLLIIQSDALSSSSKYINSMKLASTSSVAETRKRSAHDSNDDDSVAEPAADMESEFESPVKAAANSFQWSEVDLINKLWQAGFEETEIVYKSRNMKTVLLAVKQPINNFDQQNDAQDNKKRKKSTRPAPPMKIKPPSSALLLFDVNPPYFHDGSLPLDFAAVAKLRATRVSFFHSLLRQFQGGSYEAAALMLHELYSPSSPSALSIAKANKDCSFFDANSPTLSIGDAAVDLVSEEERSKIASFLTQMKPWKKGPLNLFGTEIDTEWRYTNL